MQGCWKDASRPSFSILLNAKGSSQDKHMPSLTITSRKNYQGSHRDPPRIPEGFLEVKS